MTETKMQLVDWLDDLCVRFIINLPHEELQSAERICFQVEEAQWFYEDFIRPVDPTLPSLNLRQFLLLIFQRCPLLAQYPEQQHLAAFNEFLAYKVRVPVRGAIMLDQSMDEVVLVKGWKKSANWSFPRGKINKDEDDLNCAIREVYEETGFNIAAAGLVQDKQKQKHIEVTMREQHMKLFVFRGVQKDTVFLPRTRKEISKIQWYKLAELPGYHKNKQHKHTNSEETISSSKLYMVAPFMQPLKKWIAQQRKTDVSHLPAVMQDAVAAGGQITEHGEVVDDENLELATHEPNEYLTNPTMHYSLLQTPTEHDQQTSSEAASQLKKVLSVGQAKQQIQSLPTSTLHTSSANNLLAILRQGSSTATHESALHNISVPKTPLEQISLDPPPAARAPHHHQPALPSMAFMPPPPRFPLPPSQSNTSQNHNTPAVLSDMTNFGRHPPDQYPTMPIRNINTPQSLVSSHAAPNPWTDQSRLSNQHYEGFSEQAPPGFHITGERQFDPPSQAWNARPPSMPPTSQLPAQSLTVHKQSLLDALMSKGKSTPVETPGQAQFRASPLTSGLFSSTSAGNIIPGLTQPAVAGSLAYEQSRSRQALGIDAASPIATQIPSASEAKASVVSPALAKPNTQRDALLSLFGTKPTAKPTAEMSRSASNGLLPGAFELSAVPSPRPQDRILHTNETHGVSRLNKYSITSDIPLEHRAELPATPSPNLLPQILKREVAPKHEENVFAMTNAITKEEDSPPRTSATLPGPPNVPDLGTVKRKQRAPKSPSMDTANVFSAPPGQDEDGTARKPARGIRMAHGRLEKSSQQKQPPAPIQILKRPTAEALPSPLPKVAVAGPTLLSKSTPRPTTPASPARIKNRSPKLSTPKPFQPQILRRPQSSSFEVTTTDSVKTQPAEAPLSASAIASPAATVAQAPTSSTDRAQSLLSLFAQPKAAAQASGNHGPTDDKQPLTDSTNTTSLRASKPMPPTPNSAGNSLPTNHTNSLLSLLSPKASQPTALPPKSEPPTPSVTTTMPPPALPIPLSAKAIAMNSRSSAVPVPAPSPSDVLSARSRINSVASIAGSGAQTPISPSDRGFLVNYLRGL